MIVQQGIAIARILVMVLFIGGFCLITNTAGDRRAYFNSAIPLTIQLNSSVPSTYVPPIQASIQSWNNLPSSYWMFALGANTSASSVAQDGVNLLFFDIAGNNFPPPTSVIAFSSTFSSSAGGYHATESDLIWNARDFPPSPTGAPGQQDLESVVTHEFGHHLGLDHTGLPGGANSGCGPQVQPATMWWSSSNGDTTKRSLHAEDVMGVSVLYPTWRLQGVVTSNSAPVATFPVWFKGSKASTVGPVENPIGSRFNRSGYLLDSLYTDINGQYSSVAIDQSFDIIADGFGFERDSTHVQFSPPGGIGQTEIITKNFQLQQTPAANLTGVVRDAGTLAPIVTRVEIYGFGDPNGMTAALTTGADGSFSISLPSKEYYRIVVIPPPPYIDKVEIASTYLPTSGTPVNVNIPRAQVLIVDDDGGATFQTTYQSSVDRLNYTRRTFSVADSATTPANVLAAFPQKPVLLWFTGNDSTNALTLAERLAIVNHLSGGGRVIITGQNIAQFSSASDTLLARYLGIRYNGNSTAISVRGFTGDIIGNGVNYLFVGGPNPQTSKDILSLVAGSVGTPTPTLYYLTGSDTTNFAGVRVAGPGGWAATFFGVGLEGIAPARQDTFIVRSLRYFNQISTGVRQGTATTLPDKFELEQNYPNPFNPSTEIRYALPAQSDVRLMIFDVIGREVTSLVNGVESAGFHQITWNGLSNEGKPVASGVYLYKLEAASGTRLFTDTKKLILLR